MENCDYFERAMADSILPQEIQSSLHTKWLGRDLHVREVVDSTNIWAKNLAEKGAAHGTVVIADEQTQGKGRRGRSWMTPRGSAVALTKVLRPDMPPERASMFTLVEGLSVAQAVRQLYGLDARIKWPNDVVVSRKKICGILTEMNAGMDGIHYLVIGTGINTNLMEFPQELQDKATSLAMELGHGVNRTELIRALLESFEANYEIFSRTWDLSGLIDQYNAILVNRGRQVKVLEPGNEYTGTALGIDEAGQLLVERQDKTLEKVYAGEVSVRGLYGYV